MPSPPSQHGRSRIGFTLLNLAFAALGVAFVLAYIHPFGVRLTPDSAAYVAAARSVMAGYGLVDAHGRPLGSFPPLYPLVLGAASLGVFDPTDVAGPLNALVVGLTIFVVGQYLVDRLKSRFLAAWGCLMTALVHAHLLREYLANTESLFVLLSVLALASTDRFLANGRTQTLLWAAVLTALACLTRYIGVSILVVIGLVVLLHPQAACSAAQRMRRLVLVSLVVTVPVALWFARNLFSIGSLTRQPPPPGDLASRLREIWDAPFHWLGGTGTSAWPLLLLLVVAVIQRKRLATSDWRPAWLFGAYLLSYGVTLLVVMLFVIRVFDSFGGLRFWVPLYLPLMIATLCVLDRVLLPPGGALPGSVGVPPILHRIMPDTRVNVLTALVVILLSLYAARAAHQNRDTLTMAYRGDPWLLYNEPRFTGSGTLRFIREMPGAVGMIYTNDLYAISLHAHRAGLHQRHLRNDSSALVPRPTRTRAPSFLVWFKNWNPNGFYDSDYGLGLRTLPGLEQVAEFEDGVVYRVVGNE